MLILTGILGALRSLVHIAQPIVMADHVPIERYPPAYGLYMLLAGAISLSVGPMIGKLIVLYCIQLLLLKLILLLFVYRTRASE